MKAAIMQPYFLPYIGYWQLINAVDIFVIFDDVNYIKKGWINRNRIIVNNKEYLFTLSLDKASQNKKINELYFKDGGRKEELWKTVKMSYAKGIEWKNAKGIISDIILNEENNLSKYIEYSIRRICKYLDIKTEIIISSNMQKDDDKKGQEKIIQICRLLGADIYINPCGGVELYSKSKFEENDLLLKFLFPQICAYEQTGKEFIGGLSILDMLAYVNREEIKQQLGNYELR